MRRITLSVLVVIISLLAVTVRAMASGPYESPRSSSGIAVGPYEGNFSGYVRGDKNSRAPITLVLIHRGDDIKGIIEMGDGLYVDGGICGGTTIPPVSQSASGKTRRGSPDQFSIRMKFDVSNIEIVVDMQSQISTDGKVITAEAMIDLPWICGRDPVLRAKLDRND